MSNGRKVLVDINDDRFWDILFDVACIEGHIATRLGIELERIAINSGKELERPDFVKELDEVWDDVEMGLKEGKSAKSK